MNKLYNSACFIWLCLFFVTSVTAAKNYIGEVPKQNSNHKHLALDCERAKNSTALEINNYRAYLGTGGEIFYRASGKAGFEIPKGSGIYSIFAGALWLGAFDDDGNLKLAAQTYRSQISLNPIIYAEDFWPGPLDDNGQTNRNTCASFDKVWTVAKSEIDAFKEDFADGTLDNPVSASLKEWRGPFVDVDENGSYNSNGGDYPKIDGKIASWYVINDKGNIHTASINEDGRPSDPMGIQIETMVYGFDTLGLENAVFIDYTLTNKSFESLRKTYLGTWIDPDLGNHADDFVGCDTKRNMGICYNGDAIDEDEAMSQTKGYGEHPPFVALQILEGIVNSNGEELGMSAFVFYNNPSVGTQNEAQTDPRTAQHYYNYLTGLWKDDTPITRGGTGYNVGSTDEVPFMFPDDPSDPDGWSECAAGNTPSDRRFVMSTGPFDLLPGASKKMSQALLWKRQTGAFVDDNCPSFESIQQMADNVLEFYDMNLKEDNIPPVINIDGCEICEIQLGDNSFIPSTATAFDNIDGEITEISVDASDLDPTANGVYNIVYTATDSNGNTGVKIVEVIVGNGMHIGAYNATSINLYPNPANNFVTIDLQDERASSINIYSINGQLALSEIINNKNIYKFSVSSLNKGVYIYEVLNAGKVIHLSKLVVN